MPDEQGNTTWDDIKSSIAFRLNRPSLPRAFIQLIAEERVDVLANEGYWPSQVTDASITTEQGQWFYTLPPGTVKVVFIRFLLTQVYIPVYMARRYEDILLSDPVAPPFTAIPSTARVYGRALRLFPTPNGQYPLELSLDKRISVPPDTQAGNQDTTNFWVNEGRALIVNVTCQHIAQELLRDPDRAALHEKSATEAKDSLAETTFARNGPHYVEQS